MAWIEVIDEGDAHGTLARMYTQLVDPESQQVDNILKIHSLLPAGLRAHLQLYSHAMAGTPALPKVERELIALTVSKINGCHY